jgi:hypothetical protein
VIGFTLSATSPMLNTGHPTTFKLLASMEPT